MLQARHRLRSHADFAAALRGGRSASTRLVVHATLTGLAREDVPAADPPRVGLVVSKAVGNAPLRNRTKRRLRHLMIPRLSLVGPGCDVVIRANPAAAQASYDLLGTDLDRLLPQAVAAAKARRRRSTT